MTKIPEAVERLFHRKWICKNCKTAMKADHSKVRDNKLICRNCQKRDFRPKKKEKRIIK